MRSATEFLETTYVGSADAIKEMIAKECENMPVHTQNVNIEELPGLVRKYIYPQLMKSPVEAYTAGIRSSTFEMKTKLATIFKNEREMHIDWEIETILMTKKYLNKQNNGVDITQKSL